MLMRYLVPFSATPQFSAVRVSRRYNSLSSLRIARPTGYCCVVHRCGIVRGTTFSAFIVGWQAAALRNERQMLHA